MFGNPKKYGFEKTNFAVTIRYKFRWLEPFFEWVDESRKYQIEAEILGFFFIWGGPITLTCEKNKAILFLSKMLDANLPALCNPSVKQFRVDWIFFPSLKVKHKTTQKRIKSFIFQYFFTERILNFLFVFFIIFSSKREYGNME